jgi:hypothetical protein
MRRASVEHQAQGGIAVLAFVLMGFPNGDQHAFVVIPCEDGDKDCEDGVAGTSAISTIPAAANRTPISGLTSKEIEGRIRARFPRNRGLGVQPPK